MKKLIFAILAICSSLTSFSQITFEKGYIINNSDNTVTAFIKLSEMVSNPSEIKYKLSPDGEVNTAGISTIKEFGIGDNYKFIRKTVKIDQSPDALKNLSRDQNPIFKEETVFLRSLVEGEYSLLSYNDGKTYRFFIRNPGGEIEQLIYKRYLTEENIVRFNNRYKQQLMNNLECEDITEEDLRKLDYEINDLVGLFKKYNECKGNEPGLYYSRPKGDLNVSVKAGLNFTYFEIEQDIWKVADNTGYDINPSLGFEVEYVFPMANKKLSFYSDPYFSMYSSEKEIVVTTTTGNNIKKIYKPLVRLEYKSIDIPFGIRYYMFLNESNSSKLFIAGGASVTAIFNQSEIIDPGTNENESFDFEQNWEPAIFGGVGFRYNNRFTIEGRYFPKKVLTDNQGYKIQQDNSFLIVAGYTLF